MNDLLGYSDLDLYICPGRRWPEPAQVFFHLTRKSNVRLDSESCRFKPGFEASRVSGRRHAGRAGARRSGPASLASSTSRPASPRAVRVRRRTWPASPRSGSSARREAAPASDRWPWRERGRAAENYAALRCATRSAVSRVAPPERADVAAGGLHREHPLDAAAAGCCRALNLALLVDPPYPCSNEQAEAPRYRDPGAARTGSGTSGPASACRGWPCSRRSGRRPASSGTGATASGPAQRT